MQKEWIPDSLLTLLKTLKREGVCIVGLLCVETCFSNGNRVSSRCKRAIALIHEKPYTEQG